MLVAITLLIALTAVGLMFGGTAQAAQNELPDRDLITGTESNATFVEIAQEGNGVKLDAPVGWTKLTYPVGTTTFRAGIFDGCFENTWDWYGSGKPLNGRCNTITNTAYITEFLFCESDADGNRKYTDITTMQTASDCVTVRNDQLTENTWTNLTIALTPPTTSDNNKSIIVAAHFPYHKSSPTGAGRINRFRMRAGLAANSSNTQYTAGFVGGLGDGEPNAVQNGRDGSYSNFDNDYTFRFGIPCDAGASPTIRLRWQDADHAGAGGSPSDANVNFVLRNVTTGESITSAELAFITPTSEALYIGGQDDERDVDVGEIFAGPLALSISPGDQFEWEWNSIQRNNGVQFWIPYDSSEYYFDCVSNEADCESISFTAGVFTASNGRHYVQPGAKFEAEVKMENTGTTTWTATDSYRLGTQNPQDNEQWAPLDPSVTTNRVAVPSSTAPGSTATFAFEATAPDPATIANPIKYDFDWRMVQDGVEWFGSTCRIDIYVAEQYQIDQPTGGSSTNTFVPGANFDWTYNVEVENSGDGDSRNGPSAANDGIVDVRFRYLRNGSVITGIPQPDFDTSDAAITYLDDVTINGGGTLVRSMTVVVPSTLSVSIGDDICVQARARYRRGWEGGPIITTSNVSTNAQYQWTGWGELACMTAKEQAYLEVHNNSVWAGGDFASTPSGTGGGFCPVPGGQQAGFIRSSRLSNIGAFADYIVGASWNITRFGSGGSVPGQSLSFANTPTPIGRFNSQGLCITNLVSYLNQNTAVTGVSSTSSFPSSSGQFVRSGNLTFGGETIPGGRQITLIVQGDAIITDDIVFGNYSAMSKGDIPSFILVATGDIRIRGAVENLDGLYFALGEIDTCSDGPNNLDMADCTNHLRIRGSFVANDIEFRRTYGGVSGANANGGNREAEEFVFSAEMYLADHIMISDFHEDLPITHQTDLPPVIY